MSKAQWDRARWRRDNPGPPWTCVVCGDPIMVRGQTPESLAVHHENGMDDREALVPLHYRCHNAAHAHSADGHPVARSTRRAVAASNRRRAGTYSTACKPGCTCRRHIVGKSA